MKIRFLIAVSLAIFVSAATAQTAKKDSIKTKNTLAYRAEIGYGQYICYGDNASSTYYRTIRLGGNIEIPLKYNIGIEIGLQYHFSFGNKNQNYVAPIDTAKYSYTNHTFNIPVRVTYTQPIFWGLKLFAYAGPTFGIGLAEPTTLKTYTTKHLQSSQYDAYNNTFSRFNMQLGAGGGIQWRDFRVKSGYDWGIISVSQDKNNPQYKKGWFVSFEYEF